MARLLLLTAVLLLSGCLVDPGQASEPDPASDSSDRSWICDSCDAHLFLLRVIVSASGPHAIGVPFPTGDWCLQADDWALGSKDSTAVAQLNQTDRGTVLLAAASGDFVIEAHVDVTDRSTCQPFRYDPWSIDPDPADGQVEVHADGDAHVRVEVVDRDGWCWTTAAFEGDVNACWSVLQQLKEQPMICA